MEEGGSHSTENPERTREGALLKPAVARALLTALSSRCRSYCILTGYDLLPESFDTDIDFMVGHEDFARVPALIEHVAETAGTRLFGSTPHEIMARAYLLAHARGPELTFVQPDSTSDYRHFGKFWLPAAEILASRRLHPKGFYVPGPAYEFIYYLIKRLNKRDFRAEHGARLSRLYAEAPGDCDALLARFWSKKRCEALSYMAHTAHWSELIGNLEPFRRDLLRHAPGTLPQKAAWPLQTVRHTADRLLHPTGGWISLMGPDGCGKSSVIDAITVGFAPAFREVRTFHLRPRLLRGNTTDGAAVVDPHGKKPRGWLASVAKMAYLTLDYLAGYALRVLPAIIKTRLVIFDRYFYDILVDTRRFRYGGPAWLLTLLARIIPQPELTLLLNAPPEVLWSRKQEVTYDEVVRQQQAYLDLARRLKSAVIIDASQPLADVIRDVNAAIVSYFSSRTQRRLRLDAPSPSRMPQRVSSPTAYTDGSPGTHTAHASTRLDAVRSDG